MGDWLDRLGEWVTSWRGLVSGELVGDVPSKFPFQVPLQVPLSTCVCLFVKMFVWLFISKPVFHFLFTFYSCTHSSSNLQPIHKSVVN